MKTVHLLPLAAALLVAAPAVPAAAAAPAAESTAAAGTCTRIYYNGSSANPYRIQITCTDGSMLTIPRPSTGWPNEGDQVRGGHRHTRTIKVGDEMRTWVDGCALVRNLRTESAGQTRRYC